MSAPPTDPAEDLHRRATAAYQARDLAQAAALCQALLEVTPDRLDGLMLLGASLGGQGRWAEAEAAFVQAARIAPGDVAVHSNLGAALRRLGRGEAALASYDRALALDPGHAAAHLNRANLLIDLEQWEAALASSDAALALSPDLPGALNSRGNALGGLRRWDAALASYDRSLAVQPGQIATLYNRGRALAARGRIRAGIADFEAALAIDPRHAQTLAALGHALSQLGRWDEAEARFGQAVAAWPDQPYIQGHWLQARMRICRWEGLDAAFAGLERGLDAGARIALPFALVATPLSAARQRRSAEIFAADAFAQVRAEPLARRPASPRLKLGYYSADFHDHATAYLIANLIERHDRDRFEVIGLSFGPDRRDAMRARLSAGFDRFIDVAADSDAALAQRSRDLGVDIAIDLKGYTTDSRPGVFARRAAPVQVSFLGYPGTLGAPFMDYLVADPVLAPAGEADRYAEALIRLPDTYQVNDPLRARPDQAPDRRACGLPDQGLVFCAFNNTYKITPQVFDIWMRLLVATPGAVLWLFEDNAAAAVNLRREAGRRGVASERLVFAPRLDQTAHLARHLHADLFLDTTPCSAHTTASDALWMGVPVVTLRGQTFAGRVAASVLGAIGLAELVTETPEAYEALALDLAHDPARLAQVKARLAANRDRAPLFDAARFTRHLEFALEAIWRRHLAGQPPAPLDVAVIP
ncbi:tetratricopeptide repeat protein [Phenylobacterium aquaticum]|uniref:O-linked N-acetylglucosamine transferase, SPINDLY family protein n=1 Tax=Phenylobacterium aquaticum TaxID=1763816 RepID=UPI0026EC7C22|nr:tetratricopeptide repeat protein [Phenylobacterium aquaticum]